MADVPLAPGSGDGEPYRSLYRRYRPQRFDEVRGQEHVTRALRNAVRDDRVGHAYLFSGPRGTGKTSTARILAMALNCATPVDGEPDGTCPSCVDIRRGSSVDVHELDAASNRGIEEMRDLLARVPLGTSGRWKVYIVDEVHQLTPTASGALLKTLEEPPGHVVFVLATTDPQKVLPTIRSRTQHFEFRLLGSDVLTTLLRDVNERAGLGLPPEAIDLVVRRGHGSARDALSVLDQVTAAGEVDDESGLTSGIVDALADQDAGRVLTAVAEAMAAGRDPRRLATDLLDHLRNGFLATEARGLVHLSDDAVVEVEVQARRLGLAGVVKAMEVVGQAAIDMRDSLDSRVTLEVALVRLASPKLAGDTGALLRRVEQLEAQVAALAGSPPEGAGTRPQGGNGVGSVPSGSQAPSVPPTVGRPSVGPPPPQPGRPPSARRPAEPVGSRPALGAHRRGPGSDEPGQHGIAATDLTRPTTTSTPGPSARPATASAPGPSPRPSTTSMPGPSGGPGPSARPATASAPGPPAGPGPSDGSTPAPTPGPSAGPGRPAHRRPGLPTRDELSKAWGDDVLSGLGPRVKAYVSAGRFVEADGSAAVYALPDKGLLARARPLQGEVEAALAARFGRPVPVSFVLDGEAVPLGVASGVDDRGGSEEDDPMSYDLDELADAGPPLVSPEQRLLEAFPGAEEVTP